MRRDLIFPFLAALKPYGKTRRKRNPGWKRLAALIEYSYRNVPYYRRLFDDNGGPPEKIRNLDDLSRIPLSGREDFARHGLDSRAARGAVRASWPILNTTGSTGIPLTVQRSPGEELAFLLLKARIMAYYGLKFRDRMAKIGIRRREKDPIIWKMFHRAGIFRQIQVPINDRPERILKTLIHERPDVITGNSGVISRIASIVTADGEKSLRPRFSVVGAEVLTPSMRRVIEKGLGCPVYDTYESMECGPIAWECRETGLYHVCDDSVLLEVIKDGKRAAEGESGEAVITSLFIRAMPFIRYRIDDYLTVGPNPCPCGLPFSTIKEIHGRKTDFLYLPGGRELFASSLAHVIQDCADWIAQYEVVQEAESIIKLRAVSNRVPAEEDMASLVRESGRILGPDVDFKVILVKKLDPGPGGKYRILRSLVHSEYD